MLPEPWDFYGPNTGVDETAPTNVLRARILPIAQKQMAQLENEQQKVDYRFTKPSTETQVKVNKEKSDFDSQNIDEPFSYALVDEKTLAVIEVETKPDAITPNRVGKGYVWN